jgi:dGTPase
LELEEIREGVPLFAELLREIERIYPQVPKKLQLNEVLRRILDRWVGDLIATTRSQIESLAQTKAGRERDANRSGGARAELGLDEVRAWPRRLVRLSAQAESERRQLKEFLYRKLYFSPALTPEKQAAERIIADLFELWIKHPEKLPPNYQHKAETEPLARVVCDYIAGMTDNYIYEQYENHFSA